MKIRAEQPADIPAIQKVNNLAFGQSEESELIDRLRENSPDLLSLVATQNGRIVGHILFSPVSLIDETSTIVGTGLGPLAVLPDFQNQVIGTTLVQEGIDRVKKLNSPFIVVLGHSRYYPRFGFQPASELGIRCDWDMPDEAFMILVLDEAEMGGVRGTARYRPEFYE